jgi:hypothetical protein
MRFEQLGCNKEVIVVTEHLDARAKTGARFSSTVNTNKSGGDL